jgi:hypothetical protein
MCPKISRNHKYQSAQRRIEKTSHERVETGLDDYSLRWADVWMMVRLS